MGYGIDTIDEVRERLRRAGTEMGFNIYPGEAREMVDAIDRYIEDHEAIMRLVRAASVTRTPEDRADSAGGVNKP